VSRLLDKYDQAELI